MCENEVLIADNSPIDAAYMRVMLERNGWKAEVVTDGIEVLQRLKEKAFALVILNGRLKRLTGEETIRRIREMEKSLNQRSVIIGTVGTTLENERKKLILAGADQCVSKPVYQQILVELIQATLMGQAGATA